MLRLCCNNWCAPILSASAAPATDSHRPNCLSSPSATICAFLESGSCRCEGVSTELSLQAG
eukprot:7037310-Prymnesium_polylepis.1